MKNLVLNILCVVVTSFFYFPFFFTFLPTVNTKMMVAAVGLLLFVHDSVTSRSGGISANFLKLSLYALAVTLASLAAMTVNSTHDNFYLGYLITVWVWLGGAYCVVRLIGATRGNCTLRELGFTLAVVCLFQCTLAISMTFIPALKDFVDSFLYGEGFMGKNPGRLYGLGCALDVAGIRFASVLLLLGYLVVRESGSMRIFFLISIVIIALVGSVIGRTTLVGFAGCLIYWVCALADGDLRDGASAMLKRFLLILIISVSGATIAYRTNEEIKSDLRFGFEGFFALAETGHWSANSTDILKDMYVFPDNPKTWIIGDGYAANPMEEGNDDANYVGEDYTGFYMDTDVGYCRFLFYFGLIGLICISAFMIRATVVCCSNTPEDWPLFVLTLVLNAIVWCKVASDVFPIIALYYICSQLNIGSGQSAIDSDENEAAIEEAPGE